MRILIGLVLLVPFVGAAAPPQSAVKSETQKTLQVPQGAAPTLPAPEAANGSPSLPGPVAPSGVTPSPKSKVKPRVIRVAPKPRNRVPIDGPAMPGSPTPRVGDRPDLTPRIPGVQTPELKDEVREAIQRVAADLQVIEIKRIASGRDRGKIAVFVKAAPYQAGKRPRLGSFPIRLETEGGRMIWEGRGNVKGMLVGWGDHVVTPYVLGDDEITLRAIVNGPGMRNLYPEGSPDTRDSLEQRFNRPAGGIVRATGGQAARPAIDETGEGDYETRLGGASVLREGASWQIVRLTYDLHPRDSARGRNRFDVRVLVRPGQPRDAVRCSGFYAGSGEGAHTAPGQGRIAEYLCELRGGVAGPVGGHVRANLLRRVDDRMQGRPFDLAGKEWSHDESDPPTIPDLVITRALIRNGRSGPRSVEVDVRNEADFTMPAVTVHLAFIDRVDGTVATRTYDVPMHAGRGSAVLSIVGDSDFEWVVGDLEHQTGFMEVSVNLFGHVLETAEGRRNNTLRKSVTDYYPRDR